MEWNVKPCTWVEFFLLMEKQLVITFSKIFWTSLTSGRTDHPSSVYLLTLLCISIICISHSSICLCIHHPSILNSAVARALPFLTCAQGLSWIQGKCVLSTYLKFFRASLVTQAVKNPSAGQEIWVQSLAWEDPLEKGMAIHSSFLPGKSHGQRSLVGYSP